jgi:hypothetical protein
LKGAVSLLGEHLYVLMLGEYGYRRCEQDSQ